MPLTSDMELDTRQVLIMQPCERLRVLSAANVTCGISAWLPADHAVRVLISTAIRDE